MEIMKKMSVAGMNGTRGGFREVTATRLVARIFGICSGVEVKETNIGKSLKFTGEFRGINGDGEEFAAAVCYLPEPADAMLAEAFKNGGEHRSVNFGFDIFVAPKEKRTPLDLGYEYKIKPLLDTRPSDPLAALIGSVKVDPIPVKQPQLTAPEPTPAPSPAPEPAPAPAPEPTPAPAAAPAAEHGKGHGPVPLVRPAQPRK